MQLVRRRFVPVAICTAALAAAMSPAAAPAQSAPAAAPAAGQVSAPVPKLDWRSCGPELEQFLCATAQVPTDYDRPNGAKTRIALTKLPASGDPDQRLGTLFTNPGGPGGSGVEFVQQAALLVYRPEVLARYDVLGFDPRGVAGSDPATCFATPEEEQAFLGRLPAYPLPGPQEPSFIADTLRLAALCQTQSPRRFSTASTANVARDMDLLRQAVGDERLAYVGYSYGTYLGATYARLFPGRVGRFVLDGTADPVAWSGTGRGDAAPTTPLGIRLRQGIGATETFAEFARLCREAGPQRCSLAALGDPATVVTDTFDRLGREPLVIPLPDGTTVTLTQQDAVVVTFLSLYSPSDWPTLADLLAALAVEPSPARVAAALAQTRSPLGARLRGEDYPSIGGGLASVCVDTAASGRVREYPALIDAYDAQKAPYFGRFRGWVGLPCEFWRLRDPDAFHGPWQQRTKATVLVIGTRFDPATPYRQTRPYADLFPGGRVLTVDGWGHTSIGKSACADAAIASYLVGGSAPRDGAECAQDVVPFAAPPAARGAVRPDVPPGLPLR